MTRRPPRYTRTATLCPYTTLCRSVALPLQAYDATFATLPEGVRQAVRSRWGAPEADPFFRDGAFRLPVHRFGHIALAVQPSRGYHVDPRSSYHDPALPPPQDRKSTRLNSSH